MEIVSNFAYADELASLSLYSGGSQNDTVFLPIDRQVVGVVVLKHRVQHQVYIL